MCADEHAQFDVIVEIDITRKRRNHRNLGGLDGDDDVTGVAGHIKLVCEGIKVKSKPKWECKIVVLNKA